MSSSRDPLLKSIVCLMIVLSLWWTNEPLIGVRLFQAELAHAQTQANEQKKQQTPEEDGDRFHGNANDDQLFQFAEEIDRIGATLAAANAPTQCRQLEVSGGDQAFFEQYLQIAKRLATRAEFEKSNQSVAQYWDKLSIKERQKIIKELNIDILPTYDLRLIQSIINLILPESVGGGGLEHIKVQRIIKREKKQQEAIPPQDEEPAVSQHNPENGKAADVSQIDCLRQTTFEVEIEVDQKGRLIDKDNKKKKIDPKKGDLSRAKFTVLNKQHKIEPIKIEWQADVPTGLNPASTGASGKSVHEAAQIASGFNLLNAIGALANLFGIDFNPNANILTNAQTFGEILQALGRDNLQQEVFNNQAITLGRNARQQTGQKVLEQATQLPGFGFFGETLSGIKDGQPGLLINLGREIVGRGLDLPEGALLGTTSQEIFANIGRRVFEEALGGLPVGTLIGVNANNRVSLEQHVGRGVVAKYFNLRPGDLSLTDLNEFKQKNPFVFNFLRDNPILIDNTFAITQSNYTEQMVNGQLAISEWFRLIGQKRLKMLELYTRPDGALNIEERPDLTQAFQTLPPVQAPRNNNNLSAASVQEIIDRAKWALEKFAFTSSNQALLARAAALRPIITPTIQPAKEFEWILIDEEWRAWLIDNAYAKTFDPNQSSYTARFLKADTSVFEQVGIVRTASALGATNSTKEALRHYFRTGEVLLDENESPLLNFDKISTQLGFRSQAEFDAVFRYSAPYPAFESVGRIHLLMAISSDFEDTANAIAKQERDLETTKQAFLDLKELTNRSLKAGLPGNQKNIANQIVQAIDKIIVLIDRALTVPQGQTLTPEQSIIIQGKLDSDPQYKVEIKNIYQLSHQAMVAMPARQEERWQEFSVGLAQASHGRGANKLFKLTSPNNIALRHSATFGLRNHISQLLNGSETPNKIIKLIGADPLTDLLGVEKQAINSVFDRIEGVFASGRNIESQVNNLLNSFAQNNSGPLAQLGRWTGFAGNGNFNIQQLAQQTANTLISPFMAELRRGSAMVDQILGLKNYVTNGFNGILGALRSLSGNQFLNFFQTAHGYATTTGYLFGRPLQLTKLEFDNIGDTIAARLSALEAGFLGNPLDFDNFLEANGGITSLIKRLSNMDLSQLKIEFPDLGKAFEDLGNQFEQSFANIEKTLHDWFVKNPEQLLDHPAVAQLISRTGLPVNLFKAIINPKLSDQERSKIFKQEAKNFLIKQLTADRTNGFFGLEGTNAALAQNFVVGALDVLLDDNIKDKGKAIKDLGLATADGFLATNFGFTISWAFDDKLTSEQKIRLGLQSVTQALNLDPAIGNLALTFYDVFFVDGGIDTSTAQGRQNLGKLMTAVGNAAGVDPQYIALANAALTGDIETTIVTFVGQKFVDDQLARFGIPVSFVDIYEAYFSPLDSARRNLELEAWNDISWAINPQTKDELWSDIPLPGFVERTNPNTGEKIWLHPNIEMARQESLEDKTTKYQQERQKRIQYGLMDAAISKIFGIDGGIVNGLAQSLFERTEEFKLQHLYPVISALAGSESGRIILGLDTADKLLSFANNPDKFFDSKGNLTAEGKQIGSQLEAAVSAFANVDLPPGVGELVLQVGAGKPIDMDTVTRIGVAQLGSFIEGPLGLPAGSVISLYTAFQSYQAASQALDTALNNAVHASGDITKLVDKVQAAQVQLDQATAALVTLGVNLVFGKTFAKLDQSLGLPPGTVSTFVNIGIEALIAGLNPVSLAITLGLWLINALFPDLFGGLFGGKKTQKIKRKVILNSYESDWHYNSRYRRSHNQYVNLYHAIKNDKRLREQDRTIYLQELLTIRTLDEHGNAKSEPGFKQLERGRYPEEVIFEHPVPAQKPEKVSDAELLMGDVVALYGLFQPDKLPPGVQRAQNKQEIRKSQHDAANQKIPMLLENLLTVGAFASAEAARKADEADLSRFLPRQIMTHNQKHLNQIVHLLTRFCDSDQLEADCYNMTLQKEPDARRKGVIYDTRAALLVKHVHWQF